MTNSLKLFPLIPWSQLAAIINALSAGCPQLVQAYWLQRLTGDGNSLINSSAQRGGSPSMAEQIHCLELTLRERPAVHEVLEKSFCKRVLPLRSVTPGSLIH